MVAAAELGWWLLVQARLAVQFRPVMQSFRNKVLGVCSAASAQPVGADGACFASVS
jgi:hypothetical protein